VCREPPGNLADAEEATAQVQPPGEIPQLAEVDAQAEAEAAVGSPGEVVANVEAKGVPEEEMAPLIPRKRGRKAVKEVIYQYSIHAFKRSASVSSFALRFQRFSAERYSI